MVLEGLGTLNGLNSPRFPGGVRPTGILDVIVGDMTVDAPEIVKRNILIACNECSLAGYTNGKEYATLLDAQTGAVVVGCRLKEGTENSVDVGDWKKVFESAGERSLTLVHNHPNGSIFSLEDVRVLIKYSALESLLLTAKGRVYRLTKTSKSDYAIDAIKESFRRRVIDVSDYMQGDNYDEDKIFLLFKSVMEENLFIMERW